MKFSGSSLFSAGLILGILVASISRTHAADVAPPSPLEWNTDYGTAMEKAKEQQKMLFIHFYDPANANNTQFEKTCLADPAIREKLAEHVLLSVPANLQITVDGRRITLLDHDAFDGMKHGPGIAMIDFANEGTEHYGYVVSVLPFNRGKYYSFRPEYVGVVLDLPAGTLTQRSMIWAVRVHPEKPASTGGEENPVLVDEARSSANYQAQIHVQGHHNWDSRFQRIIGRLLGLSRPRYSPPVEVVAESWPDQDLMDSCIDCVASWRQSDGHWSAVKAQQVSYGYDIRKGTNGIWYAAGIFAN